MKKTALITGLALVLIIAAGFFAHLKLFSQTPYVNGTDGGFYAYKVREIVEEGRMDWNITSSPPIIFLTSAAFAKFFGVFNGVKMATALFSALLGASIFVLTQYLTKSKKAALFAAFFAIVSPMSLRIAADIRKNAVVLAFMPLIVYFYLRLAEDLSRREFPKPFKLKNLNLKNLIAWRYAIPLGLTGILGVLSHSSIITIWFAFLAYFAFYFALEKKLPLKEFIPIFGANLVLVALFALFYDRFSDKLEAIAAPVMVLNGPQFESLNTYILPLALLAVPGAVSALTKRRRQGIFLAAWTLLLFLLTLSQTVGPSEYWRFLLIMFVPVTALAGSGIAWALEKAGNAALIVPLLVAIIATRQFLSFGESHFQMSPQLNEEILYSLETAAEKIPRNSYVYTSCPHHNYYWVRYFFGINTGRYPEQNVSEINDFINQGGDVYLAQGRFDMDTPPTEGSFEEPGNEEMEDGESQAVTKNVLGAKEVAEGSSIEENNDSVKEIKEQSLFTGLEVVYEDDNVQLFRITEPAAVLGASSQLEISPDKSDPDVKDLDREDSGSSTLELRFEPSHFKYLSTYLILPYELVNAINPPYVALWQIELGLPLSAMLIGLAVSLFLALRDRIFKHAPKIVPEILAIVFGVLLVVFIYGTNSPIFWGAPQTMTNDDGTSPPANGQEGGEIEKSGNGVDGPCGDGLCDQAEQEDPSLCPEDCL